jgi:mono/diheme cytochrome c family protein
MRLAGKIVAIAFIVLIAAAGVAWFFLRTSGPTSFAGGRTVELAQYHGPDPTGAVPGFVPGPVDADRVKRGEYLARAGDCAACHTAPGGQPYAGGLAFRLPFGTIYSSNITPDKDTGIGDWNDADFLRALHDGVGKDGENLYPAFPYTSYTLLTDEDVSAIKAYLFSLKPVQYEPPPDHLAFPYDQRFLLRFWNVLFNPGQRFQPNSDRPPQWNRGAYLIEALGHCGDCHTPRNLMFAPQARQKFAGALIQGWKAYNITPDREWGVGVWSDAQLAEYLADGHAPRRSSAAGPMAEAVGNSLRFLTAGDIAAMVAYLKTVPPVADASNPAAVRTPANLPRSVTMTVAAGNANLGLHVFEGACASCHGFDGSGTIWQHADLVGDRTVSDPAATNLVETVLQGARLATAHGQVSMPDFGQGYSDAEIAAVANYVTGRFGVAASQLTAADVAKIRQGE